MTPEEQEKENAKLNLEEAKKQLEHTEKECGIGLAEVVGKEVVSTTLVTIAETVGEVALHEVPILGWILTGLDIVSKVELVNEASNPYCQNEIEHWKGKVKDTEEKYKDRSDRARLGQEVSVVWRQEIRAELIQKKMDLEKAKSNRMSKESEYRSFYDKVHGPQVWAFSTQYSDKTISGLISRNNKKVVEVLKNKIK